MNRLKVKNEDKSKPSNSIHLSNPAEDTKDTMNV